MAPLWLIFSIRKKMTTRNCATQPLYIPSSILRAKTTAKYVCFCHKQAYVQAAAYVRTYVLYSYYILYSMPCQPLDRTMWKKNSNMHQSSLNKSIA